jgi:uncharacterized repeat protein (TIGR03803 family)
MTLPFYFSSMASVTRERGRSASVVFLLIIAVSMIASAQSRTYKETTLYSFANTPDGEYPAAGLLMDAKGNLYGATEGGGTLQGGTLFRLDPSGERLFFTTFRLIPKTPPPCLWARW